MEIFNLHKDISLHIIMKIILPRVKLIPLKKDYLATALYMRKKNFKINKSHN